MSDYIKREDAIKLLCECCVWAGSKVYCDRCPRMQKLDKIPADDVRENVRGEWIDLKDGSKECSVCLCTAPYHDDYYGYVVCAPRYDFCPNCGADMREMDNDG